ncbi:neutral alpha-glucosidase AB-like isoform X2 [Anneissia japonica]|uniref:neutral alpha-glucosidase AB-like isoform X2 n=1 Tax=Anneissia japonica TaxID=1529436 RepID=UPI0014258027|nr:neutral alpha-glucosidase AB-like isoform X2 [Anneissia japonica]
MMDACVRQKSTCFKMLQRVVLYVIAFVLVVQAVDKSNFKTCDQSAFCKRTRKIPPGQSPYVALLDSLQSSGGVVKLNVLNTKSGVVLSLEVHGLKSNMVRLKINELHPIKQRYEVPDTLIRDPPTQSWIIKKQDQSAVTIAMANDVEVVISKQPFRIDVIQLNDLIVSVNTRGLLSFEELRKRQGSEKEEKDENADEQAEGEEKQEEEAKEEEKDEEPGMWEETFKTHKDTKPNGPSAVGLDFSFIDFEHVYGIPEHADTFALKTTLNTDPYRLFNLDVFEYELNNPMALYGSIPYMLAHNSERTIGIFWLNAAETWVDISSNTADRSLFGKMFDLVKGGGDIPQVDSHWFSESGIIDVFILLGPSPDDVFSQYASLTGTTPIPPLFAISYHQCRWNYNDEDDVKSVDANFDEYDIPVDVIWLDIEHTDGKRYMTWDKVKFPNPVQMQDQLASKGRKMVTIIDPHFKKDDNYHVYKQGKDLGHFIKNHDGGDYDGWCWPGSSAWIDFTNPASREFYSNLFVDQYEGSTHNLFTWNDMNEPSVFNGPEVTIHKDAIHHNGWENRDVHNIYGTYMQMATAEGQIKRSGGKERPFVLSRAFFAGSQRYGAIWTGDNMADWDHLQASIPMLLSISVAGLPFVGADVGGFFKNPEPELLTRWYQAAAYQPFFRAHAHLDTKRREPWLQPANNMAVIRSAIRQRYALLPFWYTQFYISSLNGALVMRPLWAQFPTDTNTFKTEDEYMIGKSLLVHPVTSKGATAVNVYFPGKDSIWYDVQTYKSYTGTKSISISVTLEKIPVYQLGGSIVPKKERVRRCSALGVDDPYTLVVALDAQYSAKGELYIDDGHSFDYKQNQFLYRSFTYQDNKLTSKKIDNNGNYATESTVERIIVIGIFEAPTTIHAISPNTPMKNVEFNFDQFTNSVVIRKPDLRLQDDWVIVLK